MSSSSPAAYAQLGFDPAPGDVRVLDEVGAAWSALGDRLAEQAIGLRALHHGITWQGRAAETCLARMQVLPTDLQTAADACRTAGRCVRQYADDLREVQARAAVLERAAQEHAMAARATASAGAQTAESRLASVLAQACRLRDEAEERAQAVAAILAAARDDAPHSPGWFHRMLHDLGSDLHHVAAAMHDLAVRLAPEIAAVATWCSKAASVLAEVGFFVSLVPGVGDAVGGTLVLVSIGLGATALAAHAALAAAGVGSWKAVAFDGAAVALSLVSHGMDSPVESAAEDEAAAAATRALPWCGLPSVSEKEFALRAVKLHLDGAGATLGSIDLAHLGEDWPAMAGRFRPARSHAGAA